MILPITQDDIVRFGQGGESPLVGEEPGRKKQGAFAAEEGGQSLFQFIMKGDRPVQETGSGAAGAKLAGCLNGSLDDARILGQTEVVVRPDHDLLLPFADDMVSVALFDAAEIGVKTLGSGVRGVSVLSALLE